MAWLRKAVVVAIAICAPGALAPGAQASFHLMSISEVAPNQAAADTAFIELQMYAAGQNFTGGHSVTVYAANGAPSPSLTLTNVVNGQSQRTILIGDSAVAGRDVFYDSLSDVLVGAGGAVCFETIDCVSWGAFSGATPLSAGTPAPAIPTGQSLTRSIAPGCATLLEMGDDTNNSAVDFALATPSPRGNSVTPTETPCGGGGGGADSNPPQTTIEKVPKKNSPKTKAKFKFSSNEAGSTFQCKLDRGAFEVCTSKAKYKGLKPGKHKFQVFATDTAGNPDQTPAKYRFKVTD